MISSFWSLLLWCLFLSCGHLHVHYSFLQIAKHLGRVSESIPLLGRFFCEYLMRGLYTIPPQSWCDFHRQFLGFQKLSKHAFQICYIYFSLMKIANADWFCLMLDKYVGATSFKDLIFWFSCLAGRIFKLQIPNKGIKIFRREGLCFSIQSSSYANLPPCIITVDMSCKQKHINIYSWCTSRPRLSL